MIKDYDYPDDIESRLRKKSLSGGSGVRTRNRFVKRIVDKLFGKKSELEEMIEKTDSDETTMGGARR